jgi:hypothetical protein
MLLQLQGGGVIGVIMLLRAFRVTRLFKAAKSLKGLYQIFQTLVTSLPSLGNLTGLLTLFFLICDSLLLELSLPMSTVPRGPSPPSGVSVWRGLTTCDSRSGCTFLSSSLRGLTTCA